MLRYEDMWRKSVIYTQHTCTSNHTSKNIVECSYIYRQMGQLWTLFEFACSLYLTCNMVLDMDGGISRVLLCIMIFSILRLYGMKWISNYITLHRVMLDVITYRYLLHIHFKATFTCIPVKLPWSLMDFQWGSPKYPGQGNLTSILCILVSLLLITAPPLQWRHNERDGISNHQPNDCLLNCLFKAQIKENIKAPRHWPLYAEFTDNRWIPRTKGQLCEKCFHLMTSSCPP